jgi:hypothetical protein
MNILDEYLDEINIKSVLKEGFFRSEKSTYWLEEAIAVAENIDKLVDIANHYIKDVEKVDAKEIDNIAFEVTVKVDPYIKNILDKSKRNKSFITLILQDANDVLGKLNDYTIETIKAEVDWIK